MPGSSFQVFYNAVTYRWEVWRPRRRLPEHTHPSKESALMLAVSLASEERPGRISVYNEGGWPETLLQVNSYTSPAKRTVVPPAIGKNRPLTT
jgi:hypothetical protein